MKSKRILRFYFNADALEKAIDNLILRSACVSAGAEGRGEYFAEKILDLISAKDKLSGLWRYLNAVAEGIPRKDVEILRAYASMRTGISHLGGSEKKEIKRALIRFVRRAKYIGRHAEAARLIDEFYCFL